MEEARSTAGDRIFERRIVTILFVDLVGFTSLSERLDAEDVASIQDAYFAGVRETVERYAGHLEKFVGDAAMAAFGIPRTRDDDPERAVRAGLALVNGIEQLGARLGLEPGALRLRVGITTGEVVHAEAGSDQGRVTGDTVNTAARLQVAAPPGGVLLDETTALAVTEAIEIGPLEGLELKGKAALVRAALAIGIRPERSRDAAMGRLRAPTLGRERELALLTAALERVRATAGRERWLVVAPPGVGKTRLLEEFTSRSLVPSGPVPSRPGGIWRVRLDPEAAVAYEPVAQLARVALADRGLMASGLPAADRAAAVALIRDRSIAAGTAPERAAVVASVLGDIAWPVASAELLGGGAPDPSDRERRFVAWSEALDALAGPEAAVWVFEDVHWAGGDLLAFIAHAHGQVTRGGRLIVATARPSVLEREPAWCAEDPSGERFALDLPTLLSDDARGLVTALVGSALPDALVDRIVDRSDGNCLFIEELLRTWVSVGTLVQRDDGGWRLAVPADDAPLPATVQAIYSAQLDDLPASARQAARRGSVAGREFPVRALEPLGVAAGESAVEALRRRALVTGPHDGALAGPTFAYRHALLRDAGYASLARSERADLHVRLARWLEIIAGDRALDVAETIGSHYESALQSVPSLATEVADGLDRRTCAELAAQWLERAAETALGLAAQDTARALLRRALDLTPGDSSLDRARRWDLLGEATVASADMDEAGRAFEEARSIFGSVYRDPARPHDEREVARAGLGRASARLGHVLYQQIAFGPALELATETLAEIGERDDVATVRLLILRDEAVSGLTNDYRPLQGSVELTLERAHRAGDPDVVLDALYHRVAIRHEGGTVDIEEWRELATAARARGRWPLVARALTGAAMIAMDSDRPRAAASLAEAEEVAIAQRLLEQQAWIGYLRVEDGLLFGDWTAAVRHGRRVIEIAEANAYHRVAVRTWHCLVPLAAARGDRELLAHAARWHEERRDTLPDSPYARIMRAGVDLNLADAELLPAFVPEVASRLDSFSFADSSPSWYAAIERVLDAWLAAGLADAVRAALDRFDAIDYGTDPPPSAVGEIAFLRARFRSVVDGDRAGRIVAGREALASFRALPAPWWAARAIRGLEALEDASAEELAEAAAIERSLGLDGAAD